MNNIKFGETLIDDSIGKIDNAGFTCSSQIILLTKLKMKSKFILIITNMSKNFQK